MKAALMLWHVRSVCLSDSGAGMASIFKEGGGDTGSLQVSVSDRVHAGGGGGVYVESWKTGEVLEWRVWRCDGIFGRSTGK